MHDFTTALCSKVRNGRIPEEYDFFGILIGEWDIVWNDHLEEVNPRKVKGEWIFSRVLDGTAVQDLFIVPSRTERLRNKQPDAEYGRSVFIILRSWRGMFFMVVWVRLSDLPLERSVKRLS